jgi:hypothetical protein
MLSASAGVAGHQVGGTPMLRAGTLQDARANRRHLVLPNGTGYWRSDYIVSRPPCTTGAPVEGWSPQAFLVEQDASQAILPHFHEQHEFQVIVEGDGSFGRHAVRPVTVHYAGRHTGYGPIQSGPAGLWYFSLRAHSDPGARFLPAWRDRMERGAKRQLLADPVDGSVAKAIIEPQPDGIAAWVLHAASGTALVPPPLPEGAARYYIVLSGALDGWSRLSVIFASEAFHAVAGAEGARVLCLQFPC